MVSVIIPVYNAENTLATAVKSVLKQDFRGDLEIIIVNDGSTDDSGEIAENFAKEFSNIKVIQQENFGVSKARNVGILAASGEFIALLDADDFWYPEKIGRQIYFLNENKDVAMVSALRKGQKILPPYKIENGVVEATFRKLLLRNEIITPAVVFRKKIIETVGLFAENQRYAEDVKFWQKISLNHKIVILPEILLETGGGKRSFGVSGLSGNLKEMEKGFQKNLDDLWREKSLSFAEYCFYKGFYHFKYLVRLLRNQYFKLQNR